MPLMFTVLAMVFIAEMGDKSQLLLVAMASKYKVRDIMIGTALAIAVLNAIAIGFGAVIHKIIPVECISVIAGLAFFYFALSSLGGDDEDEENLGGCGGKCAFLKVFGTFFIAEFGDKTQLAALTVSAEQSGEGFANMLWVWAGACIGLYLADMLGLLVGIFVGKKLPEKLFAWLSFLLFAVFGVIKLFSGVEQFFTPEQKLWPIVITSATTILFAGLCTLKLTKAKKEK